MARRKPGAPRVPMGRFYREQCAERKYRDGHQCATCGRMTADEAELVKGHELVRTCGHLVPRAHGGEDHLDNLFVQCSRCNGSQGTKTVREWLRESVAPPWAVPGWIVNPQAGHRSRDWYAPDG